MTVKMSERHAATLARLRAALAASKGKIGLGHEEAYEAIIAQTQAEAEAARKKAGEE